MTNIDPKTLLEQAQAEVDTLKTLLPHLKKMLKTERASGPPTQTDLDTAETQIETELAGVERQISAAKKLAKKRKREIDEWKLWYQNIGSSDKSAEKVKLDHELAWRADDINRAQEKIGLLETQKWETQGKLEAVLQQMAALEAGVYDRPISEDPRLLDLQETLNTAQANLKAAKAAVKKATSPKRGVK